MAIPTSRDGVSRAPRGWADLGSGSCSAQGWPPTRLADISDGSADVSFGLFSFHWWNETERWARPGEARRLSDIIMVEGKKNKWI